MNKNGISRKDFLVTAIGAGLFEGCRSVSDMSSRPEPSMAWSALVHLGMNEWHETNYQQAWTNLRDPVLAKAVAAQSIAADHVRFDENVWRRISGKLLSSGVNQVVIDLGEAVQYPSHPELAVRGAWSSDKLRTELSRLRTMGIEPIPKLNFSATHDIWLGEYQRMLSTRQYYAVVADLIADVSEIFDSPRFFHLGLDEETSDFQLLGQQMVVVRQGDLWWHDLMFYVREVERHGSRAWMWSDYLRHHERSDFLKRMPKSVVQSPWWYLGELDPEKNVPAKALIALAELGYDVVPCSSTCYGCQDALPRLVEFCKARFDKSRILGFQMAPWTQMSDVFERRWAESADQVALARTRWNS